MFLSPYSIQQSSSVSLFLPLTREAAAAPIPKRHHLYGHHDSVTIFQLVADFLLRYPHRPRPPTRHQPHHLFRFTPRSPLFCRAVPVVAREASCGSVHHTADKHCIRNVYLYQELFHIHELPKCLFAISARPENLRYSFIPLATVAFILWSSSRLSSVFYNSRVVPLCAGSLLLFGLLLLLFEQEAVATVTGELHDVMQHLRFY